MTPRTGMGELESHLRRAVALNHQDWHGRLALAAGGEVVERDAGVWAWKPGPLSDVQVLFPAPSPPDAGRMADELIAFCRERRPVRTVGCWSLDPHEPSGLGIRLLARGFEWGWEPHWMGLDVAMLRAARSSEDLRVDVCSDESVWDDRDHPFHASDQPFAWREAVRLVHDVARRSDGRTVHVVAWLGDRPVGSGCLHIADADPASSGIYDVGVPPDVRNRGIGKIVTAELCRRAAELGCTHAVLNATPLGEPVYTALGFESFGYGQTWWMHAMQLQARSPEPAEVALAEAAGLGELDMLDDAVARVGRDRLDAPLACGMTPVEIAAVGVQQQAAERLRRHGATVDVLSACALGWRDRLADLLRDAPAIVSWTRASDGATALHVAAYDNDVELVSTLLEHGADTAATDSRFRSTPAGWARHAGHIQTAELIESHQPRAAE